MSGLAFEDAIVTSATGDLWLFRGRSLADRAIQAVTNAPVNHVGMVVALDDLPPLLWHAELGRSLPDVVDRRVGDGLDRAVGERAAAEQPDVARRRGGDRVVEGQTRHAP